MRKIIFFTSMILVLLAAACEAAPFGEPDPRPNFLIIITDDQRFDTMEHMPATQRLIFDQGVTFSQAYITTPLCCPSRASIFTGLYAHNHGVLDNDMPLEMETFAYYLDQSGYYTGLVGKYLNSWRERDPIPEGFDFWAAFSRGESRYYNPRLNINGRWIRHQDEYITYSLENYAVQFLENASRKRAPFSLVLAFNAPHEPSTPATEDLELLPDLAPYRPPSFNEEDLSDKPGWMENRGLMTDEEIQENDRFRRDQILTLISMDRSIENVIAKLEETGELDQTVVIFLSDNGKLWGEHRLTSKNSIYEESVRVPFAIRYPPLIPTPYVEERIVANIDIAPTLYELAGIESAPPVDGLSLAVLLSGNGEWREAILLEGWPPRGVYAAVHTEGYIYAQTEGDRAEFYDLETDPYQLNNSIDDPQYRDLIEQHKALLAELKGAGIQKQTQ